VITGFKKNGAVNIIKKNSNISEIRRKMLCIIKSKACKKCGGDLSLECDIYGVYIQCIQCGANWNEKDIALKPRDVETIMRAVRVRHPAPVARHEETVKVVVRKQSVTSTTPGPEAEIITGKLRPKLLKKSHTARVEVTKPPD
jgi:hypothetical protein